MERWGIEFWLHSFSTSTLDGGEWSPLRPSLFTHGTEPRHRFSRRLGGVGGAPLPAWTFWKREKLVRSQASAVVELNFFVFWVITRREVVLNRRFGITYRSHLQ